MENNSPLVSIVIPSYNHAAFVNETIQSVIDQGYKNIELIIIDDGSSDNSVEVINRLISICEKRFIRFEFRHRANKGLCATLNEALAWCEGEFFAPIASDDILKPYKTSIQVDYLQKNPTSIGVFGGIEVLYEGTGGSKSIVKHAKKYRFKNIFLHEHVLPAPTQLLRLDSVKKIGGYKEELMIEDWSMWLFLTQNGDTLDYIDIVFSSYRQHQGNTSSQFDKMQLGRLQVVNMFKHSPLHNKALARTYMVAALDWQKVNFRESISYVRKAYKQDFSIFISLIFFKYLVKGIL